MSGAGPSVMGASEAAARCGPAGADWPIPPDEIERLRKLHSFDVLDTDFEQAFELS